MQNKEKIILDRLTGEILEHTEELVGYSKKEDNTEPDFIKLYLLDICYLADLKPAQSTFLTNILSFTFYDKINKRLAINLDKTTKSDIKILMKYKKIQSIDNLISDLVKGKILYRDTRHGTRTARYFLNPYFFGKYNWKDVAKIRLEIDYDDIKGKTFQAHFKTKNEKTQEEIFAKKLA